MTESEGIMIFKDTMEYLIEGFITAEQYAELTRLIYETRWGDGVDIKTIKDKEVLMIWKTLQHSVKKSKTNAKQYAKAKKKAENSPNEAIEPQNDIVVPQEVESVSEAPKQGEFDDAIEVFSNGYSDKLEDYLDEHENIIRQATDIIANSTVNPCNGSEYSVMFHKDKLRRMMDHFGTNTKDAIDFKNYIDEEISRKITEKRYEKATA